MSYSPIGLTKGKGKLSLDDEDYSDDVDDPSGVEGSGDDSEASQMVEESTDVENRSIQKRIKLSPEHEYDNDKRERSQSDMKSFECGPPLKKVKLSQSSNDRNNQNSFMESRRFHSEKDNREGIGIECDYQNINANLFAEELTSDDEILTFQYPENFDVKSLLNKTVDLSKTTKLKDGISKYVCHIVQNNVKKKLNCVVPSKEKGAVFFKLPVVGHILLRQVVKLPKRSVCSFVDHDSENTQLPCLDSMKRHPLLGTEWNDYFDIVKKQIRKHKKLLRRSLKHEKSIEKAEKERKEQKKKLKVELTLLKKKHI